jgi:hypothetical protein
MVPIFCSSCKFSKGGFYWSGYWIALVLWNPFFIRGGADGLKSDAAGNIYATKSEYQAILRRYSAVL